MNPAAAGGIGSSMSLRGARSLVLWAVLGSRCISESPGGDRAGAGPAGVWHQLWFWQNTS